MDLATTYLRLSLRSPLVASASPLSRSADRVIEQVEAELQKHPAAFPQIVLTSSDKGQGIPTLRAIIAGLD